ncbi:MAG TPA: HAMP domain-containing sensor histidine kinase [Polyangia bacterium]|nr:HAMP domain-containing sensor histidine kinase [Polyangia bacterium]
MSRARDADDPTVVLAVVAHEMKNALAPLGMTLQLVERQLLSGQAIAATDLAFSRAQVRVLSGLVNDLLDQAQIDLAALPFRPQSTDVCALVQDAVQAFRRAHDTPVAVDVPAAPLTATLDPVRVRQVLANLLENAARYAPAGSEIAVRARPLDGQLVRIEVADRGPGLRDEERTRIFDRFVRGAAGRGTSGLGLGLYLCRAIVEQHGGTIGVDSQPGAGCTFWINIRIT